MTATGAEANLTAGMNRLAAAGRQASAREAAMPAQANREAASREPATASEAWAALNREGSGADAVRSYLAPGPQPRYDTHEGLTAAREAADREAGQ